MKGSDLMGNKSPDVNVGSLELLKRVNPETLKLLEKYKMDMSIRELSPKTVTNYLSDIGQWLRYVYLHQENKCITEITEDEITEFLFYCKQAGNETRRNKRRMSSLSAFYKFLRKKKIISENPMEFIDRPKKDTSVYKQTFLTQEQVDLMYKKLKESGDLQLEVYAKLSLSTMARITAVSNLRWEQCDFTGRTFDDVLEKEGKVVTLYFSEEVGNLLIKLQEYRKENEINDNGWVFFSGYNDTTEGISTSSLTDWAHKIGEMIGVPELHPHDFRHSGSQLLKVNGAPIELISELLNHSGLDVTKKHYLTQDKKQMKLDRDKFAKV